MSVGRRPRAEVPATARVELRVTPQELADLREVARENRQPLATLLRDAVNTYVNDYKEQRVMIVSLTRSTR